MKIRACESFLLRVPLNREIGDSMQRFEYIEFPGVRITTEEGLVGTGYSFTVGAGGSVIREVLDRLFVNRLTGKDAYNVREIWNELYFGPSHWIGRSGATTMAQSAVDIALWDLIAKKAERPLWQVLGGCKPGDFPIYNTDAGWLNETEKQLTDEMKGLVDEGYTAVKMKLGLPDTAEDIRRVRAVRKALGDDVTLMVDVNQKWDLRTALTYAPRLEEFMLSWLEEPLHPDDVHAHQTLRTRTKIPIALGEHVYITQAFRDYIAGDAVDIVQVDVTRIGGITPLMEVAAVANSFGLVVCPHAGDMMQVHQHIVRAIPNSWLLEVIPGWAEGIFRDRIRLEHGVCRAPESPGASTEFRDDAFDRFAV